MPIITLLTDFGLQDEYVGVMKGVILSISPDVKIVDITHLISPQDLFQAAYTLKSSYRYFPKNTVHVVVVDPGVGSDRAVLAVKMNGHIFLAPDNGVLGLILEEEEPDLIVRVENNEFFLETVSQTFHGRDVFAPVAAHISKGIRINQLGTPQKKEALVCLKIKKPVISEKGEIFGEIVSIDRFGNLITSIDLDFLEASYNCSCKSETIENVRITLGEHRISGLSKTYSSVAPQTPLAVIGSSGHLEIALSNGSAKQYYNADKGDTVCIRTF